MNNRFFYQTKFSLDQKVFILSTGNLPRIRAVQINTIDLRIMVRKGDSEETVKVQYHASSSKDSFSGWFNEDALYLTAEEIQKQITIE